MPKIEGSIPSEEVEEQASLRRPGSNPMTTRMGTEEGSRDV